MWLLGQPITPEMTGLPVWAQFVLTLVGSAGAVKMVLDYLKERRKDLATQQSTDDEQDRKADLENRKQRMDEYADLLMRYKQQQADMRVEFAEAAGKWSEDRKSLVQDITSRDHEITALKVRLARHEAINEHGPECDKP